MRFVVVRYPEGIHMPRHKLPTHKLANAPRAGRVVALLTAVCGVIAALTLVVTNFLCSARCAHRRAGPGVAVGTVVLATSSPHGGITT